MDAYSRRHISPILQRQIMGMQISIQGPRICEIAQATYVSKSF